MCRLCIERLPDEATAQPDIPGLRLTIVIPDEYGKLETWQDLLAWLQENPQFIAMLISVFLLLLGGIAPPPKR